MRFAWMVKPRNYLLLACHVSNEAVQLTQLGRKIRYDYFGGKEKKESVRIISAMLLISEQRPCSGATDVIG